ncbi:MAG: PorT family protein [Chitinophagaceae bacterium]|nr:PorT family protein [Chitinophagaceae bacterium]
MKKVVLICASAIMCSAAYSQVKIGPMAGINVTKFHNKPTPLRGDKRVINPRIGVLADIYIGSNFHFSPGLTLSRIGFYAEDKYWGEKATFYVHVAEFPLYLTYQTKKESGFLVGAGVSPNININGRWKGNIYNLGDINVPLEFGGMGEPNRITVGAGGNIGYAFKNGLSVRAFGQTLIRHYQKGSVYNNFGISGAYLMALRKKAATTNPTAGQ